MGTFGPGNFASDQALDTVGDLTAELEKRVDAILADDERSEIDEEGEGVLMPAVAIISLLAAQCGGGVPKPEKVQRWSAQYLALFDAQIADLDPAPGYKEERRGVIADTFARLAAQSREMWGEDESS